MLSNFEKEQIIELAKKVSLKYGDQNPPYLDVEINQYPHIFFLGCVMDRQIPYEKAFKIPQIIAKEIGPEFSDFAAKDEDFYINFFVNNRLHRFNTEMAKCFYYAIQKIKRDYNSNAENIWNDNPSSTKLVKRLKEFRGVGIGIANMIVNVLQRRGYIDTDKKGIDISPDRNSMRVLESMGLIKKESKPEAIKIARKISPDYPGILDKLFWEVGKTSCLEDIKKCYICKLKDYCLKIR
ncbi:MAG: iron-sulfur cluster loop [Bacilli bacterium]|nr:iron-sulfur cluster loop [Bacilli bacterium]